jgi:hypothetical protein
MIWKELTRARIMITWEELIVARIHDHPGGDINDHDK